MEQQEHENENPQLLIAFEELIEKNIAINGLTNEWLANQLSISVRTLYRVVQEEIGLSPNLYIRKIKMQKAKELLESGHYWKVKEVGEKVGFQKIEYFSKLFKAEYGLTPSEVLKNS